METNNELNVITGKLENAANVAIEFFKSKLINGSYGEEAKDIACYYKSVFMFILSNEKDLAKQMLDFIASTFMQPNGDFLTSATDHKKSEKPEYREFWAYTNGWIVRAAQRMGYEKISQLGYQYLEGFYNPETGGMRTNPLETDNQITDVLMTAHFGLINLERENLDGAKKAGEYLCSMLAKQKANLKDGMYLRLDGQGKPITQYPSEMAVFHFVSKQQPNQLYFMVAYPAAYLALLYEVTSNKDHLKAAKGYLDFALSCHEDVYESRFSHKLAWASSILFRITQEEKYLTAVKNISEAFLEMRSSDGIWFLEKEGILTAYDQSPEIVCWFKEISKNLQLGKQLSNPQAHVKYSENSQLSNLITVNKPSSKKEDEDNENEEGLSASKYSTI